MEQAEIAANAKTQDGQPGIEREMQPRPEFIKKDYKASGKLEVKIALITGGDSGIGRAVSFTLPKKERTLPLFTSMRKKRKRTSERKQP